MRELKYVKYVTDIPTRHLDWQTLDVPFLKAYIEGNYKLIWNVDVGMAEDWSCVDWFWRRDSGYNPQFGGVLRSSWATPTVVVTFMDQEEEVIFACVEPKKVSFWISLKNRFTNKK
jgi:hypothetical protein